MEREHVRSLCTRLFSVSGRNALITGQIISLLIAGTGVFASLLSNTTPSSNIPSLMSFINYALLSTYLFRNKCEVFYRSDITYDLENFNTESTKKYVIFTKYKYFWYFLEAILDLEANFVVITAYNYTSVTSIMLLDCFTIPCVMTISILFLGYSYTKQHILGVFICIFGLSIIVYSDTFQNDTSTTTRFPNPIAGDVLCLISSMLYACSNVLQEILLKFNHREVFLGYLGSFGSIFALLQLLVFNYYELQQLHFNIQIWIYILGFVFCLFFMYTNTSIFLQKNDSTLFNLSLLTSDVYAVIYSYFLYGHLVHWLYFLAFIMVFVGLTFYHIEVEPKSTSVLSTINNASTGDDEGDDNYDTNTSNITNNNSNRRELVNNGTSYNGIENPLQ